MLEGLDWVLVYINITNTGRLLLCEMPIRLTTSSSNPKSAALHVFPALRYMYRSLKSALINYSTTPFLDFAHNLLKRGSRTRRNAGCVPALSGAVRRDRKPHSSRSGLGSRSTSTFYDLVFQSVDFVRLSGSRVDWFSDRSGCKGCEQPSPLP